MKLIENRTMDEERALFGMEDLVVRNCRFSGPADGESALKKCKGIVVEDSLFNLRYPLWHDDGVTLSNVEMTEDCRAAVWYSRNIDVRDSRLHGIKVFRECDNVSVSGSDIRSFEYGWKVNGFRMDSCPVYSEYAFLYSSDVELRNVTMTGKYYLQYVRGLVLDHCSIVTKDALWETEDVYVRDSVLEGEYLAWYSKNVTFENCLIKGTQPLCYCKNLKLVNCRVEEADYCFEESEVDADITSPVLSIRNPRSGTIVLPSAGEIIQDAPGSHALVRLRG